MPEIVIPDLSHSLCLEQFRKTLCDVVGLDQIANLIDTYILKVVLDVAASAQAAVFLLFFFLSNRSVGTAYFDCVQLEESANASRYNIMENGDFRTGKWDTWSVFGWRFGDDCTSSETKVTAPGSAAAPQMDRSSMRFVGGTSLNKQAYQNILISGSAGDVYALGCWAKGDSVPLTSGTSRRFGIVLRFYYSDGTEGEEIASFNPDCNSQNDWQYLSLRAVAKKHIPPCGY